jgi:hypothetical protein
LARARNTVKAIKEQAPPCPRITQLVNRHHVQLHRLLKDDVQLGVDWNDDDTHATIKDEIEAMENKIHEHHSVNNAAKGEHG